VTSGGAKVIFGGPQSETVELNVGDVAVLPAGTGRKRFSASWDLEVVGAGSCLTTSKRSDYANLSLTEKTATAATGLTTDQTRLLPRCSTKVKRKRAGCDNTYHLRLLENQLYNCLTQLPYSVFASHLLETDRQNLGKR